MFPREQNALRICSHRLTTNHVASHRLEIDVRPPRRRESRFEVAFLVVGGEKDATPARKSYQFIPISAAANGTAGGPCTLYLQKEEEEEEDDDHHDVSTLRFLSLKRKTTIGESELAL